MSASYAVIAAGGRQLRVSPGETVRVDRLSAGVGEEVSLERVLLVATGEEVRLGAPHVDGAVVKARVLGDKRDRKVLVFKRKRRKMYRRRRGHRQWYTLVKIESIEAGS
ncbi:MAG: 50S ribosomal protein L21 [Acidobacteriota bacterium]|nr:50S ribosomal protein L21 [Acidobacteriota bacterium]MDQ7087292.1 50S ribosomal protein L21 [Acidobacteriota bacterium]